MDSKVCSACGVRKPLDDFHRHPNGAGGRTNHCKPCKRAYGQRWRAEHAEEYAARRRELTAADPQPNRDRASAWYRANKQRALAKRRADYLAHREERKAAAKRWRDEHPQRKRANDQRFRTQNRERVREYQRRYRAHKEGVEVGTVDRAAAYDRDHGLCGICGEPVDAADWHLDHIIPLSKGGPHTQENVQVAHPRCNRAKGGRLSKPR